MDDREKKREYQRKYYENNKEYLKQCNKETYEKDKERWQEYGRNYYRENASSVKENYQNTKKLVECKCGCKVLNKSMGRHVMTKRHSEFMKFEKV